MYRASLQRYIRLAALLVLLLIVAFATGTMSVATTGQAKPATPPKTPSPNRIVVDAHDTTTLAILRKQGATLLVDYGAFTLWDMSTISTADSAHVEYHMQHTTHATDLNTIYLRTMPLDTTHGAPMPTIAAHMQQTRSEQAQFWMLQFIGPIKEAWLTDVQDTGVALVAYIPNNAYVLWGDGESLANLDELATNTTFIHWMGPYHPFYRLEPTLQHTAHNQAAGTPDALIDVTVQLYATATTQHTLDKLMHLGGTVYQHPDNVLHFVNIALQLPASQLATVASWPDVFNVEPWSRPHMLDEIQGQLMANNVVQKDGVVVPEAPGYIDWLNAQGFPTDPERYPIIDIVDSGLDTGNVDYVQHPDFYEFGDKAKQDRITSIKNCTWESSGRDSDGHGTINLGIAGAYNNLTGIPYQDEQGYRIGLGISPYGRFASTRVFDSQEYFDASNCGNTFSGVIATSFESGAVLTSNSWGRNYNAYNADTQAYDARTRDATSTMPGNQAMLHIFSAGNAGPETGFISSPGLAKNVLSIGSTNSVRDDGVKDGCGYTKAHNAHTLASFSSRGPTSDGRAKPDLVAPGTHIQGPASQDATLNGWGVCGAQHSPYYPVGQTLYTWSSGTSHSAPAVAGAASLLYEYYDRILNPGQHPSPAMVKALLINSTSYLATEDNALPGQGQGWGTLNMSTLFNDIPRSLIDESITFSTSGQEYETDGIVANSDEPLRVSLVWSDAPGTTTGNAYVNNLDLEVTINGRTYRGNVFDKGFSSTGGLFDERNNVENVFVPARAGDFFTVRVIAANIAGDGIPGNVDMTDQDFALVISNDSTAAHTTGNLAGTVSDATTGAPLAQAHIQAIHTSQHTITTRSDDDGTFSIQLPEGTYTLNLSAYGFETQTEYNITLTEETTTYDVALQPQHTRSTVQGHVRDDAGRPLYARIDITSEGYAHTLFTDPATGAYHIPLVPEQVHTFIVHAITGQRYQQRTLDTLKPSVYASETTIITPSTQIYTHDFALHVDAETCNAPGYHKPTIFFADFEGDNGGFTTSWTAPWEWGIPTSGPGDAFSGRKVWGTNLSGTYPNDEHSFLVSPSIDLRSYQGQQVQLFWWQWLETEEEGYSLFDYVQVEISNDGGMTWSTIYGPTSGAVDMTWTRHSIALAQDYMVSDFRMRFLLHSDSSINKRGYYIDNVGIQPIYTETLYEEDFETSDGGFTPGSNTTNQYDKPRWSWEWGKPVPEPAAHSGTRVWATNLTGSYDSKENSFIVSPAIDLSGYADKQLVLSWWEWLWTEDTYDYASVEISTNGGTTWQEIHGRQNSSLDRWVKRSVELDRQDAVANFYVRFRLQANSGASRLGYYIDDVRVDSHSYACEVQTSGVVSGYVYDAETDTGLNKVTLDDGTNTIVGTFQAHDTHIADTTGNGFYALFLPPGTHVITATYNGSYATEVQTVTVQANATTLQHFHLSRNWLAAQAHVPDITQQMDAEHIATVPLTLYNHLDATTSLTLNERVDEFVPDRLEPIKPLSKEETVAPAHTPSGWLRTLPMSSQIHSNTAPLQHATSALQTQGELLDVLVVASAQAWQIRSHLENYDAIHDTTYFNAAMHTPTLETMLAYDAVVVIAEEPFDDPVALGDVLANYVDSGGKVVQTVPTFYSMPTGLWGIQGRFADEGYSPLIGTGDATTYAGLGTHEATHPIMHGVVHAGDSLRQHVEIAPGAQRVAAWSDEEPFIATKGAVVALNTYLADGATWHGDIDTVVYNSLIWLQSHSDIAWLSVTPITSSVEAASVMTLALSIDPSVLRMELLGDYETLIQVVGDTPDKIIYVPVNITLTRPDDAPDDITLSTTSIAEHAPAGTVVGTFSVQDSTTDAVHIAQQTYTYSLVEGLGDIDNDLFTIENSNTLIAQRSLDYETKKACRIRVQVTTPNNRILQKRFTIFIEDRNEAPTDIILSNNTVRENQPEATVVGTFACLDEDNAGTHTEYISHTYSLVAGNGDDDNAAFMLDDNHLKTATRLDYEQQTRYSVRVQATDFEGFAIERVFNVIVEDTFDNQDSLVLVDTLDDAVLTTRTNDGLLFRLGVPPGAIVPSQLLTNTHIQTRGITYTIGITYTESPPPTQESYPHDTLAFAGHRFMLDVYAHGVHVPHMTFAVPVSITLGYQDRAMEAPEEHWLQLYEQQDDTWTLVGDYPHGYIYDSEDNTVTIEVDYTGAFALFYEQWLPEHMVYLPLIARADE